MTIKIRLLALLAAIAVNAAALTVVHQAMVQIAVRERLAQTMPERIVVTAPRFAHSVLATRNCPNEGVL